MKIRSLFPFKISIPFVIVIFLLFSIFSRQALAEFTLEDEKKLGAEIYDKMEKSDALLKNTRINAYITRLGNAVLLESKKVPFDFRFLVVDNSAINAFATPGGYVYVNKGLILLVENESELASVIAHELGHANARHIADTVEKSTKINIATMAALLAGALLGGQGAAAVTTFSLAAASTASLKYSRENEEEADRLGASYLAAAGYTVQSAVDFMKIMRRYEFYSSTIPSYFLTHPGTDQRISYLDGLIQARYSKGGATAIVGGLNRIQTLLLLDDKNNDQTLAKFQTELKKNPKDVDALYGIAVIYGRLGQTTEAQNYFDRAMKIAPGDPDVLREMGICYLNQRRTDDAVIVLEKAYAANEADLDTIIALGRAYDEAGNYPSALELYFKANKGDPSNTNLYYNLAMTYGRLKNPGESHYNFGIYFKKKNKRDSALFHFKEALPFFPSGSDREIEIQKEIESLTKKPSTKDADPDARPRGRPGNARLPRLG
jgi:beta-barrel assembly-enhancing protease